MKKFIGFEKEIKRDRKTGHNFEIKIFNSKFEYIGKTSFSYSSTRGSESEVYNFLINNKILPKKAFNYSISSGIWAGYYRTGNPFCIIKIIN